MEEPDPENERGPNTLAYNKKKMWILEYEMEKNLDILLQEMAELDNTNGSKEVVGNIEGQSLMDQIECADEEEEEKTDYEDLYENIYEDLQEWDETCQMNKTSEQKLYENENWYEVFNNDIIDKKVTLPSPSVDLLFLQLDDLMESLTEVLDKLKDSMLEDSKRQTIKGKRSMTTDTIEMGVERNICHFRYSLDESISKSWSYQQLNTNEQKAMNYLQTAGLLSTSYRNVIGLLEKTVEAKDNEAEEKGAESSTATKCTENETMAESRPTHMSAHRFLRKFSLRGQSDTKEPTEDSKRNYGFEQLKTIVFDERKAESNNKAARVLGLSSFPLDEMTKLRKENEPTTEPDKTVDKLKIEPGSKAARVLGLQQLPYHANGAYMRIPPTPPVLSSRQSSWLSQGKTKHRARSASVTR